MPGYLEEILAGNPEIRPHLDFLKQAYSVNGKGAFHFSFLKPLRDSVGFHYKEQIVLERLKTQIHTGDLDGNIIIAEFSGLGRYTITDHMALSVIYDLLGGEIESFKENYQKAMGEAIQLAGSLQKVVDEVLLSIFKIHQDAIKKTTDGKVSISPSILKAKKVDRMRDNISLK